MFEKIGTVMRILRESRKLKQKDLAARVGAHIGSVSRWESDQTRPSIERLDEVMEDLGVSIEEFCHTLAHVNGVDAPELGIPEMEIERPEEYLLAQTLMRAARGESASQWLREMEDTAKRMRRVATWATHNPPEGQTRPGRPRTKPPRYMPPVPAAKAAAAPEVEPEEPDVEAGEGEEPESETA